MSWHGTVSNGRIVLDDHVRLPEGAQVEVQVVDSPKPSKRSAAEILAEIAAMPIEAGPSFAGRDHDNVLYGDRDPA